MTPLRQQMIAALQLSGKGERTQQSYVREVRLLAQFYGKSPDLISELELQTYFLHRKNVDGLAPNSMRICYSAIRFFYQHVLKRDWHTLSLIRAQTEHRLPAVLSVQEVRLLLKSATPPHNQVYFTTVYSLGLRLHEGLYLQVADIDGQRLPVRSQRIVDIGHTHLNLGGELCPVQLDLITKPPNFAEQQSNGIDPASLPQKWHDNSTTAAAGSINGFIIQYLRQNG